MRLSDAIILGSTLRKQVQGALFKNGGSCAIGAAIEACGVWQYDEKYNSYLTDTFPWKWLICDGVSCVECRIQFSDITGLVVRLNDHHSLTREQIAEWVASVEPKEDALQENHIVQEQECSVL